MPTELAAFVDRLNAWRAKPLEEQAAWFGQAASFAGAVVDHLADGGRLASAEVEAEREAICFSCEHHDPEHDACLKCGCGTWESLAAAGLTLARKRSWTSSACPLKPPRWESV